MWQRRYPQRDGQWEAHLQFLPDGRLLTSAQQGETLVWDASAGRILRRYPIGGRFALSPDRRRIAIARNSPSRAILSSSITVLHLRTGKQSDLASRLNDSWIGGLAYTRDGKRIVAAANEMTTVWDVASQDVVETYGTKLGPATGGVVLDHRGLALDSRIRRHHDRLGPGGDAAGRAPVLLARTRWVPRQSLLRGRSARRRDGVEPRRRHRDAGRPAHQAPHRGPSRARRDVRGGDGLHARRPAARDRRQRGHRHDPRRPLARDRAPAALPGTGQRGGVLARRQAARGPAQARGAAESHGRASAGCARTPACTPGRRPAGGPDDLAFTRDGRVLVASACPATVVAWDARSGEQRLRVPAADQAHTFALSPDSRVVAAGSAGGRVRLWDLRTGRPRGAAIKVAGADIIQLAISPDGRLLAVGACDGTAAVWDLRTRTRLGESFPVVKGLAPEWRSSPTAG